MISKKIVITGGATRIGAAIAKSLASYETSITIHYNKSKTNAFKLKKELEKIQKKEEDFVLGLVKKKGVTAEERWVMGNNTYVVKFKLKQQVGTFWLNCPGWFKRV